MSATATEILIGIILRSGGHRTAGLADTELITGGVVSFTVTLVTHVLVLCDPSVTLQFTEVVPNAKVPPDPVHWAMPRFGQLSVAVGVRAAVAPAGDVHSCTTAPGQVSFGASISSTSICAVHAAAITGDRRAVRVAALVPRLYGPLGAVVSVNARFCGSKVPLSIEADAAVQVPGFVSTFASWHLATGGSATVAQSLLDPAGGTSFAI